MAGALEGGRPRDAVESGKRAVREARRGAAAGEQSGGFFPEDRAGREAAAPPGPRWSASSPGPRTALEKLRRAASPRAKGDLQRHGKDEQQLAERARELAKKGEDGRPDACPRTTLDRLEEAEQADARGRAGARPGRRRERPAKAARRAAPAGDGAAASGSATRATGTPSQREAEARRQAAEGQGGDPRARTSTRGPTSSASACSRAWAARRDPLLREAVKRYAEGLLK